uniref:Asparaginase n=1 Tax=Eiseniibacteriota bacterium TaxID=2212470 RepID=A0A832I478_UNCEI
MRLQIDVTVWRGPIAEARHRVQAAVCDPAGATLAATAGAGAVTGFRSAAKPFQALPLLERGHDRRFGLDDETLAVLCASHTGSPRHVACVRALLARLGLEERHLACGFHPPEDPESQAALAAGREAPSPVFNNCSGKHAGMLALALAEGWPVEGYERPDHPVQRLMLASVAEAAGVAPEAVPCGVDGCSVPAFGLSLAAMARAYARLAAARRDGDARERAMARVRDAMIAHPRATAGAGRFSAALMEAAGGAAISKVGAEGLECVGLPERGLGLAVKCEDGAARAVPPAVVALLETLEALAPGRLASLGAWRAPEVRNHAGRATGTIEAAVRVLSGAGA